MTEPYYKRSVDPNTGETSYEPADPTKEAEERLRLVHGESLSMPGQCRNCLHSWPCPSMVILAALTEERRRNTTLNDQNVDLWKQNDRLARELREERRWREAIIDAAVVGWTYTAEDENDPRGCLNRLLAYHQQMALDPAVSKEARDLVAEERRKREEAEAERWADFNCHLEGTDNEWLIEACNLAPDQHVSLGVMRIIIEAGEWKKRAEEAEREARVLRRLMGNVAVSDGRDAETVREWIAEARAAEEGE